MNNGLIPIYMSIYFMFMSKDWLWIEVFAAGVTLLVILCAFILPESPKFLLSKSRWSDARAALSYIGRFNMKSAFTGKFDRERMNPSKPIPQLN